MNSNKSHLDNYIKILNILNGKYFKFQKNWQSKCLASNISINLKNKQIRHIYDKKSNELESKFLELLKIYYDLVEPLHIKMKVKILEETNIRIESRIKDFDSLLFKINKKAYDNDGAFPINKVINDILGFRLIDIMYMENIDLIYKYVEAQEKLKRMNRVKVIDRSIDRDNYSYNATHIYFKGDNNFCIPLELQIWDKVNEDINRKSHKIHKQGYIDNIEQYKLLDAGKGVE